MQPEFTPGPWTLAPCELETRLGQPFCGKYYVEGPYCSDGRFDEPDAHLISAAPDLYAALRELIERRDRASAGKGERERDGSDGRYARARAALAKAEGRE